MLMARGATAALVGALVAATALVGASAANAAPGSTVSERSERTVDTAPAPCVRACEHAISTVPGEADRAQRGSAVSWSPPLAGEAVGVTVSGRTVRLAADREQPGPARADGHGAGGTPGLLTLPARHMDVPVDRVDAVLTLAAGSPGAAASVDVRGLRARGGWTEWEPGVPTSGPAAARTLRAVLPEPVVDVQARLVLTLPTETGWAVPGPVVRDLTLTAHVATRDERHGEARPPAVPGVRHPRGPRRRQPRRTGTSSASGTCSSPCPRAGPSRRATTATTR